MNIPAPFSQNQMRFFWNCFDHWFNVAEGGKRGGKNVLITMAYCTILEKQETARLTAADLAKLAISLQGGRKGVQPGMCYAVLFNKADTPEREAAAWEAARQIRTLEKKLINAKYFKETFMRNPTGEVEISLAKKQFSDREMREKSGSAEWGECVILTASHLMPPWNPQITGEAK